MGGSVRESPRIATRQGCSSGEACVSGSDGAGGGEGGGEGDGGEGGGGEGGGGILASGSAALASGAAAGRSLRTSERQLVKLQRTRAKQSRMVRAEPSSACTPPPRLPFQSAELSHTRNGTDP
jgi:hypothetical protein